MHGRVGNDYPAIQKLCRRALLRRNNAIPLKRRVSLFVDAILFLLTSFLLLR